MATSLTPANASNAITNAASSATSNVSAASNKISGAANSLKSATDISARVKNLQQSAQYKKAKESIDNATQALDDVSSTLKDPIGASLKKVIFKISDLTSNLESKVDELEQSIVKKIDFKGRVEITGATITVVVKPEEYEAALAIKTNVEAQLKSIRNTITLIKTTIGTLKTVGDTIKAIKVAMDIQDLALSLNPASGPVYNVLKKGLKLVILKDVLTEHSKLLLDELKSKQVIIERIIQKFSKINVQIKVSDEADKGNTITDKKAKELLALDNLGSDINDLGTNELSTISEEYNSDGKDYYLVVEKYSDNEQLIGKAKDKFSGLIVVQTAPSYFATGPQLIQELKNILDSNI